MFDYYDENDRKLSALLPRVRLLDGVDVSRLTASDAVQMRLVHEPDAEYAFLHEAAIAEHKGTLYAAWYNCPREELVGNTPIRGRRSTDGGATWSDVETLARDANGRNLYCPPIYAVCSGKLYLFMNEMVAPDHMRALELHGLDENSGRFERLWSRRIPFKLNASPYRLRNGALLLPGRVGEPDGFPSTPAVLISDSGKVDAEWRLVRVQDDDLLADGSRLIFPELSAIVDGKTVYLFCRDDQRNVPLLYVSHDDGEHFDKPVTHDIPFSASKIYSGTLSCGRNYVIGNLWPGRGKLAIFFSRPGEMRFDRGFLLQDGRSEELGFGVAWHYPVAWEANGKLYVIYTVTIEGQRRGAALSVIALDRLFDRRRLE